MLHPYHLGASLYMPATRSDIWHVINRTKLNDLDSIIICLEDAVTDRDIDHALANLQDLLAIWQNKQSPFHACTHRPLVFLRPRNPQMLRTLSLWDNIGLLDGFVLPKFDLDSLPDWQLACQHLSPQHLLMPTLETKLVFNQSHNQQLVQQLATTFKQSIFALRIGGNDLLACLNIRRPHNTTVYESPIGQVIYQLINDFVVHGFYLTAPVFEYLNNKTLLQQEVQRDVSYGLVGKTIIHPHQIDVVRQAFYISHTEYSQAQAILATDAQAVFKQDGAMLEPTTHKQWAEHILIRKQVFGIRTNTDD